MNLQYPLSFVLAVSFAAAQAPDARSMFFDPTSGVRLNKSNPLPATAAKPVAASPPATAAAPQPASVYRPVSTTAAAPRNTGLRYWIELLKPNGELQRVTTAYVFRSGDEIRLHVETNVDGRLTIFQTAPGGQPAKLFPDARVNEGSNLVRAHTDTIVPSAHARFAFDNNAGVERLSLLFEPSPAQSVPAPQETSLTAAAAEAPAAAPAVDARSLQARVQAASRSLFTKVDPVGKEAASYAVNANWDPQRQTGGEVALELTLLHK